MARNHLRLPLILSAAIGLLPACGQDAAGESAATDDPTSNAAISRTGIDGGFFYSCQAGGGGTATFTPDGATGYSVVWSNVGSLVCGKGWNPGAARTVTWTGAYENTGGGAYGIYGWTVGPVVEYYVVEKAGNAGSPAGGTAMGSYTSDGATYTVYRRPRINQPCVVGNACTFYQYVALRQSPRTSGTITLQNHFAAWTRLGMRLGTFSYQLLATEAWNGSGYASVKLGAGGTFGPGTLVPQ